MFVIIIITTLDTIFNYHPAKQPIPLPSGGAVLAWVLEGCYASWRDSLGHNWNGFETRLVKFIIIIGLLACVIIIVYNCISLVFLVKFSKSGQASLQSIKTWIVLCQRAGLFNLCQLAEVNLNNPLINNYLNDLKLKGESPIYFNFFRLYLINISLYSIILMDIVPLLYIL